MGRTLSGTAISRTRHELLRRLNTAPWAGNVVRWSHRSGTLPTAVDAVIAVPACNEEARIEACLEACARSASLSGLAVRILVLVNGTDDGTSRRALAWAARPHRSLTLVEVDFVPDLAHAGAARRLVMELAGANAAPDTVLLTTDADAQPSARWVGDCVEHLRTGTSLVCGRVALDPDEEARLPPHVLAVGHIEHRYRQLSQELERLMDPDPWNPHPHHGTASGASLAIRVQDLRAVGGVPLLRCAEDKALARRVRAHALPVVFTHDAQVTVSCRTVGRAPGGMADTLAQRAHDLDPSCDEQLESAASLHARLAIRARLRRAWPRPDTRTAALIDAGADAALAARLARSDRFDDGWDTFESIVLEPARRRLSLSDIPHQSNELLERIRTMRVRAHRVDDPVPVAQEHSGSDLPPSAPRRRSRSRSRSRSMSPHS